MLNIETKIYTWIEKLLLKIRNIHLQEMFTVKKTLRHGNVRTKMNATSKLTEEPTLIILQLQGY